MPVELRSRADRRLAFARPRMLITALNGFKVAPMEIMTERLLLREFTQDDARAFLAYHADPRYAELYAPEDSAPDHAQELLRLFSAWALERPRLNYQLAIAELRNPRQLLGCCGLRLSEGWALAQPSSGSSLRQKAGVTAALQKPRVHSSGSASANSSWTRCEVNQLVPMGASLPWLSGLGWWRSAHVPVQLG